MNTRPKSKIARVAEVVGLCLIPFICIVGFSSMALLSERPQSNASLPHPRHYDLERLLSDAHQVVAVFDYLTEIEPPVSRQVVAQNVKRLPQPQPVLSQSNYTFVLVTNRSHSI